MKQRPGANRAARCVARYGAGFVSVIAPRI